MKIRSQWSRLAFPVSDRPQVGHLLLHLELEAPARASAANLALVLDRSGSMEGAKMEHLRGAVRTLVGRMTPEDRLAVVVFDDEIETPVASGPVGDPDAVRRTLEAIPPRGGTQIAQALSAGLAQVLRGKGENRVSRIVLLTDGQTHGDEEECRKVSREATGQGVSITCLGVGEDWNESLLLEIAESSGGHASWVVSPDQIRADFVDELTGVQGTRAAQVELQVRLEGGAALKRAVRTRPLIADLRAPEGREARANLGALDQDPALLFEVVLPPHGEGSLAAGRIEIQAASPKGSRATASLVLEVPYRRDPAACGVVAEVSDLAERVGAFHLQTVALQEARTGKLGSATVKLQALATRLLSLGEEDLAREAGQEAQAVRKTGSLTDRGTKVLQFGTRKLTQKLVAPKG